MAKVWIIDAANVVGSRPDGWWKDRAGAARRLHESLLTADLDADRIVLVLEGAAKAGMAPGRDGDVRTVHAARDGDAAIVEEARAATEAGDRVFVITADRVLRGRIEALGAIPMGPGWLLDQL